QSGDQRHGLARIRASPQVGGGWLLDAVPRNGCAVGRGRRAAAGRGGGADGRGIVSCGGGAPLSTAGSGRARDGSGAERGGVCVGIGEGGEVGGRRRTV